MNKLFSCLLSEFESDALVWAKSCNGQRELTHGFPAFKGNACKTLLDQIDILRQNRNLGVLEFKHIKITKTKFQLSGKVESILMFQ